MLLDKKDILKVGAIINHSKNNQVEKDKIIVMIITTRITLKKMTMTLFLNRDLTRFIIRKIMFPELEHNKMRETSQTTVNGSRRTNNQHKLLM